MPPARIGFVAALMTLVVALAALNPGAPSSDAHPGQIAFAAADSELVVESTPATRAPTPTEAAQAATSASVSALHLSSAALAGQAGSTQAGSTQAGSTQAEADRSEQKQSGPRRRKVAHLTFDDGPSDHTAKVLRILTRHDATATFFALGSQAEHRQWLLKAIRRQGSSIGNHTRNHAYLPSLTDAQIRAQLKGAPRSKCFRPPYGATNPRVRRIARSMGMRHVLWSADSRDWEVPEARAIQRKSLIDLKPGAIILMHDGGGDRRATVASLPGLLKELTKRGYVVRALPGCDVD